MSDTDTLRLVLTTLEAVQTQMATQALEMRALRDSVIRLETHGYGEQLAELRAENKELRGKVIVMETQGRVFSVTLSAGVAVIVSVISALLGGAIGRA